MNMPDVTAILYDPEVGGGVEFTVERETSIRSSLPPYGFTKSTSTLTGVGNIQPQEKSIQSSTTEDLLTESIVIYSTFLFQTGSNTGTTNVQADIVTYNGLKWRVTKVEDWSAWGFTKAYATRTMETSGI